MVIKNIIISLVLFTATSYSALASYSCTGTVTQIGVGDAGALTLNIGFGVHTLCNLSVTYRGITPEACRAWHATALASRAQSKSLAVYFVDDTGKSSSACNAIGNWVTPVDRPYFVEVYN